MYYLFTDTSPPSPVPCRQPLPALEMISDHLKNNTAITSKEVADILTELYLVKSENPTTTNKHNLYRTLQKVCY